MTTAGLMARAVVTGAMALTLAGCGGTSNDTVTSAAGSTPPPSGSPAPTGQPSAPATSSGPKDCPLKAKNVPAPAGAQTDLTKKPTVAANPAPPPADVTVADLVVGTGA